MTSVDECRGVKVFEAQEGQPTESYITMIVEAIGGVLFTLRYDVEKGKGNPIGIIMEDDEKITIAILKAEAVRTQDQDPRLGPIRHA